MQDLPSNRVKCTGLGCDCEVGTNTRDHFSTGKSVLSRNEDICVHEGKKTPTLETGDAINSTARTKSCLVKVCRSLWSYHPSFLLFSLVKVRFVIHYFAITFPVHGSDSYFSSSQVKSIQT